jgi:hypothetical protein
VDKRSSQTRRVSLAIVLSAAIVASYELGRRHAHPQACGKTRHILFYVDPMYLGTWRSVPSGYLVEHRAILRERKQGRKNS